MAESLRPLTDKVVVVTGAGRGIGRAHALELAAQGAAVLVNDLGTDVSGHGETGSTAAAVVDEIKNSGGRALASTADVSSWAGSREVIEAAVDGLGGLDGLVNNAGILRKVPVHDLEEDDVGAILNTHLKGSFGCTSHACRYWYGRHRNGEPVRGAVVNTISEAMFVGLPGYSAYNAAKGGIANLTLTLSVEGAAYGVRCNAYGPRAMTRMMPGRDEPSAGAEPSISDPRNTSTLVAWLISEESNHVSGQLFYTVGGGIGRCTPWATSSLTWPPEGAYRFEHADIGRAVDTGVLGSRFASSSLLTPAQ